jgi:hypothetical protein
LRDPGYRRWAFVALIIAGVLLAASPAAAVNRDGLYRGMTSQDRLIRFVVEGEEIRDVRLSVFHESCNLTVLATSGNVAFRIEDDNTFVMRFFANGRSDKVVVRGEFTSRNRARGTFRSVQDNADCTNIVRGTWRVLRVQTATA